MFPPQANRWNYSSLAVGMGTTGVKASSKGSSPLTGAKQPAETKLNGHICGCHSFHSWKQAITWDFQKYSSLACLSAH